MELNPMRHDSQGRSSLVEALTEEPRGPDARQSYSNLIKILEKSTSQIFHRGPNKIDNVNTRWINYANVNREFFWNHLNKNYFDVYKKLIWFYWIFAITPYLVASFFLMLIEGIYWTVYTIFIMIPQIIVMFLIYTPIVLISYNLYDFVCYVYYKLFVAGASTTFELTECFAKKNKFYYEEIKQLQWDWRCYGKILRRYRTISLFFIVIFLPIITYEATPQLTFRYDGGYLFGEYYNEVASGLLFLFGFGEWYDILFNRREDLDILIESYLSNAKVLSNDFVDNMSYIQVMDFIAKEGFVFLQTDDKRVKVLLHQLPPNAFHLLMENKPKNNTYYANKVYEIEAYLKIQIREGQLIHGDHVVIVNKTAPTSEEKKDDEEKQEVEEENENEGAKFRVIVQSTVIGPWTLTTGLTKERIKNNEGVFVPKYPTMGSRMAEVRKIWFSKLWLAESQVRLLRLLIIIFTIFYAIDELQDCRVIDTHYTKYLVIGFLLLFFMLVMNFSFYNAFTSYHTFLFDEKTGDTIKIFNNRYIQKENNRKLKINDLSKVAGIQQDVLDKVLLSVRSSVNYNPFEVKRYRFSDAPQVVYRFFFDDSLSNGEKCCIAFEKGGFRFSDIIHILERLCLTMKTLSLRLRVELFRDGQDCFEIIHSSKDDLENVHNVEQHKTLFVNINIEERIMRFTDEVIIKSKSAKESKSKNFFKPLNKQCESSPLKVFVTRILNDDRVIARKIISYIELVKDVADNSENRDTHEDFGEVVENWLES